jgi:hypothetical protein
MSSCGPSCRALGLRSAERKTRSSAEAGAPTFCESDKPVAGTR